MARVATRNLYIKKREAQLGHSITSRRKHDKDGRKDGRQADGNGDALHENHVLYLAEDGLLDSNFLIKDLANDISFLIFSNPRL